MSSTRIKRAKAPQRRPARTPKKRRKVQASRLDAFINALPVSPATLQRVANWTIGVSLAALISVGAHATGVTAKNNEEWAQTVARAGFQENNCGGGGAEGD